MNLSQNSLDCPGSKHRIGGRDSLLAAFLAAALLFPFLGFVSGTDTQPVYMIVAATVFVLSLHRIRYRSSFLVAFFAVVASFSLRFFLEDSRYLTFNYVGLYYFSVLTFLITHVLVRSGVLVIKSKWLLIAASIYSIVGVAEFLGVDVFAGLVSRSVESLERYSASGRGVRSLASEPSTLGKIFTIINVLLFAVVISERKFTELPRRVAQLTIRKTIVISCLLLVANAILSQSTYALAIHFILLSLFLLTLGHYIGLTLFLVVAFLSISVAMFTLDLVGVRAIEILRWVIESPERLLNQGAMRRVLNVPISVLNGMHYGLLGAGNSPPLGLDSMKTPVGNYDYAITNRNHGGLVEYFLKFGFASFPLFIIGLLMLRRISKLAIVYMGRKRHIGYPFVFSILLLSFQDGSPAFPLTVFLFIYLYEVSRGTNGEVRVASGIEAS